MTDAKGTGTNSGCPDIRAARALVERSTRLREALGELARLVDGHVDGHAGGHVDGHVDGGHVDGTCARSADAILGEALRHGRHVCCLAMDLFAGLADLHGLDEAWRLRLAMASLLHDMGQVCGREDHHLHTLAFLVGDRSPDPALKPLVDVVPFEERVLTGLLARYHRGGWPSMEDGFFASLPMEERRGINLCASLLRMADGLDVRHVQEVARVGVRLDGVDVCLNIHGREGVTPALEEHARRAVAKGDLFTDLFARRLQWRLF